MENLSQIKVNASTSIRQALEQIDRSSVGALLLFDANDHFARIVTDGDLRRLILKGLDPSVTLQALPAKLPITLPVTYTRREALQLMNQHQIHHIPVLTQEGVVCELLLRHELDEQILLSTPHMGLEEESYIQEAFRTNWIAPLGPNVDAFESELAEMVGVKAAAAVSSGTAALHLALRLLGVGTNDTVFCSTLTFVASVNPILYQGAKPVFIDSEFESWNMCPIALKKAFEHARQNNCMPKAVIVVSLYGQSANMDPIVQTCHEYGVPIVEDAAESLGAFYKGQASGTFGTFGVYSFNGNKIITTSGGGMLVSNDEQAIRKARFLATQARDPAPHYEHTQIGYNYRMSNLLAGVGRGQLKVLKQRVEARRNVYQHYVKQLADLNCLEWMPEPSWGYATHWLSAVVIKESATFGPMDLIAALSDELIEGRPIWKPMHLQPVFSDCAYFTAGVPEDSVSDRLFQRGLCLPSGSNLTESQVNRVCEALRKKIETN